MDKTFFAPSERIEVDKIELLSKKIKNNSLIVEIFDSLPYIAALLNKNRQVIFGNKMLLDDLGGSVFEKILGYRPGELIKCTNAKNNTGGCGTSKNCKYCGAVNAILQSQTTHEKISYECRIITEKDIENKWLDLEVTASPFRFDNTDFTILTIKDISDKKRRIALEQIFFHDIVNKVGNLNGLFELAKTLEDKEKVKNFLDLAFDISQDLTEEILAQRQLLAAENNKLQLDIKSVSIRYIVTQAAKQMQNNEVARNKIILVDPNNNDYIIETDNALVKRVITNMIKNAIEATTPKGSVSIGYKATVKGVEIYVHNETAMSDEIKAQIFQRSFSTKGVNRGLGTYSIKLLGEKYLKGKVSFTSNEKKGTIFFLEIPLSVN